MKNYELGMKNGERKEIATKGTRKKFGTQGLRNRECITAENTIGYQVNRGAS